MVAQRIAAELKRELEPRGVIIESVLLRDVQLPQMLRQAIEAKQQAEQRTSAHPGESVAVRLGDTAGNSVGFSVR